MRIRLETLQDEKAQNDPEFAEGILESEEIESDLLDEILAEPDEANKNPEPVTIDRSKLREEIEILKGLAIWARRITKTMKIQQIEPEFLRRMFSVEGV